MQILFEIKNRIFLIIFTWFYLIFVCYYYKKVLFFILLNESVLNQKLKIYFVYTNITELFFIYLEMIKFISLQIIFWFICYHFFIFILPALYKNEFIFLKKLIATLATNWCFGLLIIIFIIFPITWKFFENFQKIFILHLVHFEIKINEFLSFFMTTYFLLQFYFLFFITIVFLFKTFYYNQIYVLKYRKLNYLLILLIFFQFNPADFISQLIFYNLFIIYYEISLITYFFNLKIKTHLSVF